MALVELSLNRPPFSGMPYKYPPTLSLVVRPSPAPCPAPAHTAHTAPYPHTHPSQLSEILPRLFVSDLAAAEDPAQLAAHGITHVLSALPGAVRLPHGTRHLQIPLHDTPFAELAAHLPRATAFIRDALADPRAAVLVHCAMGSSRSVAVVCAYLVACAGLDPDAAVRFVKERRAAADPNAGFVAQLHEYRASLRR